ncbi:unnamed protein product [Phytophthora lilii]|uniref:Unnamed protein product n=1 Tax=Phytophthora lilii TaxID=2077276 RepID=A0A9W6WR76_9STRA|nr:unnamed protein product [Phytophthora lilii]
MFFRAFVLAAIASFAAVNAKVDTINHDQVQPFAQPKPVTDAQKTAVKYKPQLHISYGCHPYPAVQANGSISGGLEWSGPVDGDCEGSSLGSQVYSRSDWFKDKWATMYTWYFPKGRQGVSGHRHFWEYAIVWTDTPSPDNSTLLGVSMSAGVGYEKQTPTMLKYLDGTSVKLDSHYSLLGNKQALQLTKESGEFQDLITWGQLTVEARNVLNGDAFDVKYFFSTFKMPLKDEVFYEHSQQGLSVLGRIESRDTRTRKLSKHKSFSF